VMLGGSGSGTVADPRWRMPLASSAILVVMGILGCTLVLLGVGENQETILAEAPASMELGGSRPICGQISSIPALRSPGWKQRQVTLFIRHGDRTRMHYSSGCWPGADDVPYECGDLRSLLSSAVGHSAAPPRAFRMNFMPGRNSLPGNCGLAQLTLKGYAQHLKNGQLLRETYSEFLPPVYHGHEADFFLRSDNSPRTIQSGQALFEGMYPAALEAQPEQEVPWLVMDALDDNIKPNPRVCPRLKQAFAETKATPDFVAYESQVRDPLRRELKEALGFNATLHATNDCIVTHICTGHPLPPALQPLLTRVHEAVVAFKDTLWSNVKKYAAGPLLGEALTYMEAAVLGQKSYKFVLFSGHDNGPILPVLHALGVADGKWPPYGATIALELYERDGEKQHSDGEKQQHMVRMVYNGQVLTIPGCGGPLCAWGDFQALVAKVVPSEHDCRDVFNSHSHTPVWPGIQGGEDLDAMENALLG